VRERRKAFVTRSIKKRSRSKVKRQDSEESIQLRQRDQPILATTDATRQSARARKIKVIDRMESISLDLMAPELTDMIIEHVTHSDKLSLSRVSKLLNILCYPHIYRELGCLSPTTTVGLCRTLCSNKYAASAVRTIIFGPSINTRSATKALTLTGQLIVVPW
jgi:hypothetical protein